MEGDANTSYFQLMANGRRRKKAILSLEHEGELVTEQSQIQEAIYSYYKTLFGKQKENPVCLKEDVWTQENTAPSLEHSLPDRAGCQERTMTFSLDLLLRKK
jgi:hypothetical protein